jgi:hypothetical protein
MLQDSAAIQLNDYFEFLVGEPREELDGAPEGGSRYPVEARMDGRGFARFHVDVGIGDAVLEPLDVVEGRDWSFCLMAKGDVHACRLRPPKRLTARFTGGNQSVCGGRRLAGRAFGVPSFREGNFFAYRTAIGTANKAMAAITVVNSMV